MKLFFIITILYLFAISCSSKPEQPDFGWVEGEEPDLSWINNVGARKTPGNRVWNVNDFVADTTGEKLSTEAIQLAIDACAAAGGGKVIFEPGKYLTGAIFLKSNVNLHIDERVTLIASEDIRDYPEFRTRIAGIEMVWPAAVINVIRQKNVAVTGKGLVDCRGEFWWKKYWDMRKEYEKEGLRWIVDYDCKRIRGILVSESEDITLRDFTLQRTGFWAVQVLYSKYCTVKDVVIRNNIKGHGPSTDGLDIDSSTRILIEGCDIDCNDDNICLKAGRDADGLRVNRPTEYVVIRNCIARRGGGLITCGSETSGSIKHIIGYNLKAKGTSNVLRLKSAMTRGGTVEYIYMTNVEADSVGTILAADLNWNPSYSYSKLPEKYTGKEIPEHWTTMLTPVEPIEKGYPHFRHVYISNINARETKQFITASGRDEKLQLEDFQLNNMNITAQKAGKIKFSDGFILNNINLKTDDNNQIRSENNVNLKNNIVYK